MAADEAALAAKVSAYWYSFAISPIGDPDPTPPLGDQGATALLLVMAWLRRRTGKSKQQQRTRSFGCR
jgi:hypothetical protein